MGVFFFFKQLKALTGTSFCASSENVGQLHGKTTSRSGGGELHLLHINTYIHVCCLRTQPGDTSPHRRIFECDGSDPLSPGVRACRTAKRIPAT